MNFLLTDQRSDRILFRKIRFSDFDVWLKFFETAETSRHWVSEREDPKPSVRNGMKDNFKDIKMMKAA